MGLIPGGPFSADAGFPGPPKVTYLDTHNYLTPAPAHDHPQESGIRRIPSGPSANSVPVGAAKLR